MDFGKAVRRRMSGQLRNRYRVAPYAGLGIVLAAKQHGVVREARPIVENMMNAGFYLSREVVETALRRVGEQLAWSGTGKVTDC